VDLVIGRPTPEFLSARDILIRERLLDWKRPVTVKD
jgi:hypothetical protein